MGERARLQRSTRLVIADLGAECPVLATASSAVTAAGAPSNVAANARLARTAMRLLRTDVDMKTPLGNMALMNVPDTTVDGNPLPHGSTGEMLRALGQGTSASVWAHEEKAATVAGAIGHARSCHRLTFAEDNGAGGVQDLESWGESRAVAWRPNDVAPAAFSGHKPGNAIVFGIASEASAHESDTEARAGVLRQRRETLGHHLRPAGRHGQHCRRHCEWAPPPHGRQPSPPPARVHGERMSGITRSTRPRVPRRGRWRCHEGSGEMTTTGPVSIAGVTTRLAPPHPIRSRVATRRPAASTK